VGPVPISIADKQVSVYIVFPFIEVGAASIGGRTPSIRMESFRFRLRGPHFLTFEPAGRRFFIEALHGMP